jgi:hypothetical protein
MLGANKLDQKYSRCINIINEDLIKFNSYLNDKYHIPLLDADQDCTADGFVKIIHGEWDSWRFPNPEKRGVYFIFACNIKNVEDIALYIGKASFSSAIGARLYQHFSNKRNEKEYTMQVNDELVFKCEYIYSINLDAFGTYFFAPSLEEYMINEVGGKIQLLNTIGNV